MPFLTVAAALQQGIRILDEASVSSARLTAEVLLSHALQQERTYLLTHSSDSLSELAWIHYGRYLHERSAGKPTQYITKKQEFYGRDFYVDGRVLIPRPETELLVEAALHEITRRPRLVIADLGTGSGAIAISVAMESGKTVMASDVSQAALEVAACNGKRWMAPVQLWKGDMATSLRDSSVDLLLSNPPYVPGADASNMQREVRDWEPHIALFASDDGFEIYRRLIPDAHRALRTGGRMLLELGYQSLEGVRGMLQAGWDELDVRHDLAGWPRVIGATKV